MSAQDLQRIKKELETGDPNRAIASINQLLPANPDTASLHFFMAQALFKIQDIQSALLAHDAAVRCLRIPQDDNLAPQVFKNGVELANVLLTVAKGNKDQDFALRLKVASLNNLVSILEKKEKWDLFQERIDELIQALVSLDLYNDAEAIYVNKVFLNSHLSPQRRHAAVVAIFNFPSFYKPKLALTGSLLKDLAQLCPESPDNAQLIDMYLAQFDKRPKFSFYESKPEELPRFKEEMAEFLSLYHDQLAILDCSDGAQVAQVFSKQANRLFRYFYLSSITLEQHSAQWKELTQLARNLLETEGIKKFSGKDTNTPLQILLRTILEGDARVFSVNHATNLSQVEVGDLQALTSRRLTPLANLLLGEHLYSKGQQFEQALAIVNQGITFVRDLRTQGLAKGHEWEVKLQILRAKILLSDKIAAKPEAKRLEFQAATVRLKDLISVSANFIIINQELPLMIFNFKLANEGAKEARAFLEEIESGHGGFQKGSLQEDWVKSQKAWITYSHLHEISDDQAERVKIIEGVVILLKEALELNPKNDEVLLRLGTLYFCQGESLGIPQKQASLMWLQGLKQNPASAEIFYSLGLYYYFSTEQRDEAKAIKCLEKAVLLQPDLEDAGLLLYSLMIEQGRLAEAFTLLESVHNQNPLLPYPQFYMGLHLQAKGEYGKARLMLEGAARFHAFYHANLNISRRNSPSLRSVMRGPKSPFARELGIYGSHCGAVWLHLGECYLQLGKFPTTEKCAKQALQEASNYLTTQGHVAESKLSINPPKEDKSALGFIHSLIHQYAVLSFLSDEDSIKMQHVVSGFSLSSPTLQVDVMEALLLSGKVEIKLKSYHQSLMYASLALELLDVNQGPSHLVHFEREFIQVAIDSLLMLIDEILGGKADRKKLEKKKYIGTLEKLVGAVAANEAWNSCERLQRCLASTYKVIAEELLDKAALVKSMAIIERQSRSAGEVSASYSRLCRLDLAKLYHLEKVLFQNEANHDAKLQLIRGLIKENPSNGEYWVYHGIFQTDFDTKLRSFYKALQLNPKDQFALNNIICLQMRHRNYTQALKVLNHLRDIESLNALVVALMTVLHAKVAVESDATLPPQERKRHLQDAISIGQLFLELEQEKLDQSLIKINEQKVERDPRIDIHQYLSTLMYYLVTLMQYENGEALQRADLDEVLSERAKQGGSAYISKIAFKQTVTANLESERDSLTQMLRLAESNASLDKLVPIIKSLQSKEKQSLQSLFNACQDEFFSRPSDGVGLKLLAVGQTLINQKILPQSVLVEEIKPFDFKKLIDQTSKRVASDLLHQQLHLLYLKYPSNPDKILEFSEMLDENHKSHPLLAPLGCFEYEKAFHLFMLNSLASTHSTVIFHREIKRVLQRGIHAMNKFLETLQERQSDKYSYEQIARNPQKLAGYVECLWHLIREGAIDKAIGFSRVIGLKLSRGLITIFTEREQQRYEDLNAILESITSKDPSPLQRVNTISSHLVSLITVYVSIIRGATDENATQEQDVVTNILNPWLSSFTKVEEIAEDQFLIAYDLLLKILVKRGFLLTFNNLAEKLPLDDPRTFGEFFTAELKIFTLMNLSNNLNLLAKKAASSKSQNALESFLKDQSLGHLTKRFSSRFFKGLMAIALSKHAEAAKHLMGVTEESYEKDVLTAHAQFANQEYKNFYLTAIQLVTSLKQDLARATHCRVEQENLEFLLGYAYYLKARAEHTFLEARKQGITLKEDFSAEESKLFTAGHFKAKALKSISKSVSLLGAHPELQAFAEALSQKVNA